ncbi:MAG: MGS-like protein domain protein [Parcubacteria group bacterium GW2011_GWC2_42_6]|nr:MAG: MGS-like protein domain protein [Parcubacteria group bacterium GW2011_GWA2_42_11]KKS65812.1 MAG: MGS-like protein domain protein [Parcubacteria group bacterium GW2011_GWC2_42_6]KKT76276.1 MAG: MGS-like protein domain protein [Parcubacteria group bacterium GW2011_GWF2_44_7]
MDGKKRALISVTDKTGIVELAKELVGLGFEILSTGGTAKVISAAGVPVTEVSAYTGFPEILDGRVKTLQPKIHGGLLGRSDNPKHQQEMAAHGIEPVSILVVNLYAFEKTVAKPGCTLEEAIENIDIGGPAMLRAAAKNYQDVVVLTDPIDYGWVITELKSTGDINLAARFFLAKKVFNLTHSYDWAITKHFSYIGNPYSERLR